MLQERRDSQAGHWHGELVDEFETSLDALGDLLPSFHRIPFGPHPRKDIILRASENPLPPMPVGVVSKRYALLQHTDVVRGLTDALAQNHIEAAPLEAHLALTEYGTRMSLRVILPEALALGAVDGHRMALTFECFNSVDGSVPLFALVGWFRFVCRNGLVIGTTCARVRHRHRGSLKADKLSLVLADGIAAAKQEREAFARWASARIEPERVTTWIDRAVAEAWGSPAAARVHSIMQTGWDGTPVGPRKPVRPPHARRVRREAEVPGAAAPATNAYAAAQALAWVAARRRNLTEREAWRDQIGELIGSLTAA